MKHILSLFVFFLSITSCIHTDVFEKNVSIPSHQWDRKYQPIFEFDIKDTTSNYLLFFTIRHTDAYGYSNIWLNAKTFLPGDTLPIETKTEITLAQYDGKWLGRGMKMLDVWEHQMPMTKDGIPLHFSRAGTFKLQLQQIMRENPLPQVMSVGIRLEKVKTN